MGRAAWRVWLASVAPIVTAASAFVVLTSLAPSTAMGTVPIEPVERIGYFAGIAGDALMTHTRVAAGFAAVLVVASVGLPLQPIRQRRLVLTASVTCATANATFLAVTAFLVEALTWQLRWMITGGGAV